MRNGCGDESQLTSYSCFCTDWHLKFRFDISTDVVSRCGPGLVAQATSAVEVFKKYCEIGIPASLTRTVTTRAGRLMRRHSWVVFVRVFLT